MDGSYVSAAVCCSPGGSMTVDELRLTVADLHAHRILLRGQRFGREQFAALLQAGGEFQHLAVDFAARGFAGFFPLGCALRSSPDALSDSADAACATSPSAVPAATAGGRARCGLGGAVLLALVPWTWFMAGLAASYGFQNVGPTVLVLLLTYVVAQGSFRHPVAGVTGLIMATVAAE